MKLKKVNIGDQIPSIENEITPIVFISDIITISKSKECSDIISVSKNEEHSDDVADTDIAVEREKEDKDEAMMGKREEDGEKEKKIKE